MNKFKRALSVLTATALSVSAFAGLTITASAAPIKIVDDDFTSAEQADAATSLTTDYMTWSSTDGTVQVRSIGSNGYIQNNPTYKLPMPMARSNQGAFSSKDGNLLYIAGDVTTEVSSAATASGHITDESKKVTDGYISFDFSFPTVQTGGSRQRGNNIQTLSITDGTNTLAQIKVTAYGSTKANEAYDASSSTVQIGDGNEHNINYGSSTNKTTVGWYSFRMDVNSENKTVSISVTTPSGGAAQTTSYTYSENNGINAFSWSGNRGTEAQPDSDLANIALDNIVFAQESTEEAKLTTINIAGETSVKYSSGKQIKLTSTTLDQYEEAFEAAVTWASDNEEIATVDQTGLVSLAGASGEVTITATSGNVVGTHKITVLDEPAISTIVLTGPTDIEYAEGKKIQLTSQVLDQYNLAIEGTVTYSGNNDSVAVIDSSTGVAEIKGAGEVELTASVGSVTETKRITVTSPVKRNADTVITSEDFSSFTNEQKLSEQPYDTSAGEGKDVVSTTQNGITYTQGEATKTGNNKRNNSSTYILVNSEAIDVYLGDYSSSNRNPRISLNDAAEISAVEGENVAEILEFDAAFNGKNEQIVIDDGTNQALAFALADGKITLNGAKTGLSGANKIKVKSVLTKDNKVYTELYDTVTGITYSDLQSKTAAKFGRFVFGGTTNGLGKFVTMDNLKLYTSKLVEINGEVTYEGAFNDEQEEQDLQNIDTTGGATAYKSTFALENGYTYNGLNLVWTIVPTDTSTYGVGKTTDIFQWTNDEDQSTISAGADTGITAGLVITGAKLRENGDVTVTSTLTADSISATE